MKKNPSKEESGKRIELFFSDIKKKSPKEVNKIKKLAMKHNIKLGKFRKKFCKKCLNPYLNPYIRINKQIKSVKCDMCGHISRWKINSF